RFYGARAGGTRKTACSQFVPQMFISALQLPSAGAGRRGHASAWLSSGEEPIAGGASRPSLEDGMTKRIRWLIPFALGLALAVGTTAHSAPSNDNLANATTLLGPSALVA